MSTIKPFTCRGVPAEKRWAIVTMIAMAMSTAGGPAFLPTAHAQSVGGPAAVGFVLDAGDLRFIYHQIQIAEAHAAGGQLLGPGPNQVNEVRLPFGLRTVSGEFNNLVAGQDKFGAADQLFPRMTEARFRTAEAGTTYERNGSVVDSQPRIISNLIADQTDRNPAARAVAGPDAVADPSGTLFIPNAAPDVGLSAPFNVMFTFFGQFFDHGLDLVNKGGNGVVMVPLQEDDPLFVPGGTTNFMLLTRATHLPGPDGILGDNPATPADESADDIKEAVNQTSPFVDQNQTYTSHPAHQVFLREYVLSGGRPVSTGRMIDGGGLIGSTPVKNIGNWGEVKAQAAAMLGIGLVDTDALNVPLIATDSYGRFLRGPNGFPMMVMAVGSPVEGNPAAPVSTAGARKTGHAFLDDIAHHAVPVGDHDGNPATPPQALAPDADPGTTDDGDPATYDDELLEAHFCTGDGRGNENIALTAVHTVFHAEHNRLRDNIDGLINRPGFLTAAEVAAWKAQAAQPTAAIPGSGWDYGERLFQAARFVTEMQYQHLVFEEFARTLAPTINEFIGDGINFHSDTNPAIPAEFAHQAYRLGHSMLTEIISRTNQDGSQNDITLLDGFLNPLEFNNGGSAGPLTAAQAAGAIFQGGTRQVGNEIDEFVTEAVRDNLLGLPLDLGVLNLARGRSEGVAPLNSVRRDLFALTGDPQLTPYENWGDFGFSTKHGESLVNFIAAYGIHPSLDGLTAVADKRAAAEALAFDPAFLFAPGSETGVENIDLWIGGLAEKIAPFGGMLGTTLNHIFENTLESLQNADRFYYLERLDGLNLLAQMEGNSFAELISRNTTLTGPSASVFGRPDFVFNLSRLLAVPGVISDDPTTPDVNEATDIPELVLQPNGTIRYFGPAHVVWNGRPVGDSVISSEGDDTLRGDDGADRMEGGAGNDQPIGGAGDDILTDTFGEDVMKGGPGNDAILGGSGPFDLLQGNEGHDFIVGGNDSSEVFGGSGNDIIYVGKGITESFGGAGDDWIEGSESPASVLVGDENNQFQNDPNQGHDVIIAGPGDADMDSEGGDDIMVANVFPTHRLEGMLGFDWATYRGEIRPTDADMLVTGAIAVNAPLNENRDRYDLTEGLSGTNFNDQLRGDHRAAADLINDGLTGVNDGHVLTAAGIARISGLAAILPAGATRFDGGNIILGGTGSDIIEGRGGDDLIDGDRWLNVQLGATVGGVARLANSLHELKTDVFANPQQLNPGNIRIVRSIVTPVVPAADCTAAAPANCDVAVFSGPRAEYIITVTGVGADRVITVDHQGGIDGRDTLRRVEQLQFADQIVVTAAVGAITVPNLTGLTDAQARAAITGAGLAVGAVTTGNSPTVAVNRVMEQSPLAGVGVTLGTPVSFVITLGALVPDIHEQTVADGRAILTAAGVSPAAATRNVNDPEIPAGLVASTTPAAGSVVPPGTVVTINVSVGPVTANTVPAVVGTLQADAEEQIIAAGLAVGAVTFANSTTVAAGAVISTTPVAGTVLAAGSTVAVRVSLGADGLVLALGFNEATGSDALDSSVAGNDGVLRQATMQRAAGKFGSAVRFDGVDDWVTVLDPGAGSALDLTNGMTLEAWVNPSAQGGWDTVLMKQRGTGLLSYALYAYDGAPEAGGTPFPAGYIRVSGVDQPVRGNASLPLNTWTHIATTYDGTTQRFFVNGVQVGSAPMSTAIAVGNQQLRIGGNNSFTGEFFEGLIDEVRVYNRARTATQIQADMNAPIVP